MYACTLPHSLQHDRLSALPSRKRLHSSSNASATEQRAAQAIQLLLARPQVAEGVLSEPWARRYAVETLLQRYNALPADLHAAAARGWFGVQCTTWCLALANSAEMRANRRTVQLLVQQPQVTAVRLSGRIAGRLQLLDGLARVTHLTALSMSFTCKSTAPAEWLQRLGALSGLQSLKFSEPLGVHQVSPDFATALTRFVKLTSLELEGAKFWDGLDEANDAGVAAFAQALSTLPVLARLSIEKLVYGPAGSAALRSVLPSLPKLRCINLWSSPAMQHEVALAEGVAACSFLTKLDIGACSVQHGSDSARALVGLRAQLHSLSLAHNELGCADVRDILAAPAH